MHIGLVAYRFHGGVLQMYVRLCAAAGIEVTVFTSDQIRRDIGQHFAPDPAPVRRFVICPQGSRTDFLGEIAAASAGLDALLFVELQFDTPSAWRSFLSQTFRCPIHAGVHDIVLEPIPWWRMAARRYGALRGRAFASIAGFVVHAPRMRDRFAAVVAPRCVVCLPVYFRDARFRRSPDVVAGPLTLCVPGSYAAVRRDYDLVLGVSERLLQRGVAHRVVFAGSLPWGGDRSFFDRWRSHNRTHGDILSWSGEYMEEACFRNALESAHVLLAPLVRPPAAIERWKPGGPRRRTYALDAHITAAMFDAVRFQLPVVYPAFYMPEAERHPGAVTYAGGENLAETLAGLDRDRSALQSLTAAMCGHASSFVPGNFTESFRAFLAV